MSTRSSNKHRTPTSAMLSQKSATTISESTAAASPANKRREWIEDDTITLDQLAKLAHRHTQEMKERMNEVADEEGTGGGQQQCDADYSIILPPYHPHVASAPPPSHQPRIGSNQRPSEIIASARSVVQTTNATNNRRSSASNSNGQPRTPNSLSSTSSPSSFSPQSFTSIYDHDHDRDLTLTEACSDQALAALAEAQIRGSGLKQSMVALRVGAAQTTPLQQPHPQRGGQRRPQHHIPPQQNAAPILPVPLFHPAPTHPSSSQTSTNTLPSLRLYSHHPHSLSTSSASSISFQQPRLLHPPPPPSSFTFDSLLRSDSLQESESRALFDAGGVEILEILTTIASTSIENMRMFKSFEEVMVEVHRARALQEAMNQQNSQALHHISPIIKQNLHTFFTSKSCRLLIPGLAITQQDVITLVRIIGNASEGVLSELNQQQMTPATSFYALVLAAASYAFRAILHLLKLQAMVLPQLVASNSIGWIHAHEWFVRGIEAQQDTTDNADSSVCGPRLASMMETLAQDGMTFRNVDELRECILSQAALDNTLPNELRQNDSISAPSASVTSLRPYPLIKYPSPLQPLLAFFSRDSCRFFPPAVAANALTEVNELVQGVFDGDAQLAMWYLEEIEKTSTATAGAANDEEPFFKSWKALTKHIRRLRGREEEVRTFLKSDAGVRLVNVKLTAIQVAQIAMTIVPGEEVGTTPALGTPSSGPIHTSILAILRHMSTVAPTSVSTLPHATFSSFLSSLHHTATELREDYSYSLFRVREMIEALYDIALARSLTFNQDEVERVYEMCLWKLPLVQERLAAVAASFSAPATISASSSSGAPSSSLPKPKKFKQFSSLLSAIYDLNLREADEKRLLYEELRSPAHALWKREEVKPAHRHNHFHPHQPAPSKPLPSLNLHLQVSPEFIQELFTLVGPTLSKVRRFLAGFTSGQNNNTSTRMITSLTQLITLAREYSTLQQTLKQAKLDSVQSVRQVLKTYLREHWSIFAPANSQQQGGVRQSQTEAEKQAHIKYSASVLTSLTSEMIDQFLLACGVNINNASAPSSDASTSSSSSSMQHLLVILDYIRYLGLNFPNLGLATNHGSALTFISAVRKYSEEIKAVKKQVVEWVKNHEKNTSSTPLLPSSLTHSLSPLSVDSILINSGVGLHALRVMKELWMTKMIERRKDAKTQPQQPGANTIRYQHHQQQPFSLFNSIPELTAALKDYYTVSFLPYRSYLHNKLLSVLLNEDSHSMLLPEDYTPMIEELDTFIDVCVIEPTYAVVLYGAEGFVRERKEEEHEDSRQGEGAPSSPLSPLLASSLHTLLAHISLLEECQNISCESLSELSSEVASFKEEQQHELVLYLRRNEKEIWKDSEWNQRMSYSSSSSSYQQNINLTSTESQTLLSLLLSHHSQQVHLFTHYYDRVLSRLEAKRVLEEKLLQRQHGASPSGSKRSYHHTQYHVKMMQKAKWQKTRNLSLSSSMSSPSLHAFLQHLDTLHAQSLEVRKNVCEKVNASGLLSSSNVFTDHDALSLLDLISFVPEDRQVEIISMLLVSLSQAKALSSFRSTMELFSAVQELITKELNQVQPTLAAIPSDSNNPHNADDPESSLLTPALQAQLLNSSDLRESLWTSSGGNAFFMSIYIQAYTRSSEREYAFINDADELGMILYAANADALEKEAQLEKLLYGHKILITSDLAAATSSSSSTHSAASSRPNRLTLQQLRTYSTTLGLLDTLSSITFIQARLHKLRQGKPYASMQELLAEMEKLVKEQWEVKQRLIQEEADRNQRAFEAQQKLNEEQARLLEEQQAAAERARVTRRHQEDEREALRHQLRSYLSSEECTLFGDTSQSQLYLDILQQSWKSDEQLAAFASPRASSHSLQPHLLDSILTIFNDDLPSCFRTIEALLALNKIFTTKDELLSDLSSTLSLFNTNTAALITYLQHHNDSDRILPSKIVNTLQPEKEGVELMLEFDRHAQVGVEQIQVLIECVVDAAREAMRLSGASSSSRMTFTSAFTSYNLLLNAMRAHRQGSLNSLHTWLSTPSSSTLFAVGEEGTEFSATEGEVQRLLLSAATWSDVLRALQQLQAESCEFRSLTELSKAVSEYQQVYATEVASLLLYIAHSGLIQLEAEMAGSFTDAQEKSLVEWINLDGIHRTENEITTLSQIKQAEAKQQEIQAASQQMTFPAFMQLLESRRMVALTSISEMMSDAAPTLLPSITSDEPLSLNDHAQLLSACLDVAIVESLLPTFTVPFECFDLLLLHIRRHANESWLHRTTLQQSITQHSLLYADSRLTYFDTSYLLSIAPLDTILALLSSSQLKDQSPFANVEPLINSVASSLVPAAADA